MMQLNLCFQFAKCSTARGYILMKLNESAVWAQALCWGMFGKTSLYPQEHKEKLGSWVEPSSDLRYPDSDSQSLSISVIRTIQKNKHKSKKLCPTSALLHSRRSLVWSEKMGWESGFFCFDSSCSCCFVAQLVLSKLGSFGVTLDSMDPRSNSVPWRCGCCFFNESDMANWVKT